MFTLLTSIIARDTGLALGICYFTIRALQGHTQSSMDSVSRATMHTMEVRGAGEAVVRAKLTATMSRVVIPLRTRLPTLALK